MPETDEGAEPGATGPSPGATARRVWSAAGIGSAALGLLAVAAAVVVAVLWNGHRGADAEREHQTRVLATAAEWTGVLINMNSENVEGSLELLRDGTVGELNTGFEASIAPYRDVVRKLRSATTGQVESVSVEVEHNDLGATAGQRPPTPASLPADLAARTDTVLVVATSVSENPGTEPTTVRWNLRLGVSEVDGRLLVSRLESLR